MRVKDGREEVDERRRVGEVGGEDELDLEHAAVPERLGAAEDGGDPHAGVRRVGADARPIGNLVLYAIFLLAEMVYAAARDTRTRHASRRYRGRGARARAW